MQLSDGNFMNCAYLFCHFCSQIPLQKNRKIDAQVGLCLATRACELHNKIGLLNVHTTQVCISK